MKTFLSLAFFALSLEANAQTLLECKPRDGKFEVRQTIIGNVVVNADEVIFFQLLPVFRTVSFDAKKAVRETSRSGSWTTYETEITNEEVITLQIEDSGKVRRSYLEMRSVDFAEEYFYEALPLKCSEI